MLIGSKISPQDDDSEIHRGISVVRDRVVQGWTIQRRGSFRTGQFTAGQLHSPRRFAKHLNRAGFSGQTRGKVSWTDADCGLTDKLGLKFTDRLSLVFPDTCHLDFPDALHLNFPDTIYLTKATKIRDDRVTVSDGSGRTYRPRY